jgi:hypothetical protein
MTIAPAARSAAGVSLNSDQQAIDNTSPFGKAMMQMARVFGELEREMTRTCHGWPEPDVMMQSTETSLRCRHVARSVAKGIPRD